MFKGRQAAQTWRSVVEIPSLLLPNNSNRGTVIPMMGPATYQGQGSVKNFIAANIQKSIIFID
jgi:hypothetical protein